VQNTPGYLAEQWRLWVLCETCNAAAGNVKR